MFNKLKSELRTIVRRYKLLYTIDKNLITIKALRAVIELVSPYTTLWLSSRLISGIAAGESFQKLILYAALIVIINLVMSVISRLVSRKASVADQNMLTSIELYFNSVNMNMQFEHLENPETHMKKDRIFQAQNANGFGIMLLAWQVESFMNSIASIILSAALTVSLFSMRAPGNFSGFWSFINSPISVLIILALQLFHIFTGIKANAKSSNVFYKESPFSR